MTTRRKLKLKNIKSFVIDRKIWARGRMLDESGGSKVNSLLRIDDKMCCLGIYLKACGVPNKDLLQVGDPENLDLPLKMLPKWLLEEVDIEGYENSKLVSDLIDANDATSCKEATREVKVAKLFAKTGIKVTFKGEANE